MKHVKRLIALVCAALLLPVHAAQAEPLESGMPVAVTSPSVILA